MLYGIMEWKFDVNIVEFFNQLIQNGTPGHEFFKTLFNLITQLGTEIIFIVLIGGTYWGINKKIGKEVGTAAFFAMLFNNVLKGFFNRLRPFQQSPTTITCGDTTILREVDGDTLGSVGIGSKAYATTINSNGETILEATSLSFPSGHANGASAVYNSFALSIKKKWAWIVSTIICILVMVSRMVLGAHFLTDVIAGYLSGFLLIGLIYFLRNKVKNPHLVEYILLVVFGIATFLSPLYSNEPRDFFITYGTCVGLVIGAIFEEKKVNFVDAKTWWKRILRIIIGAVIAYAIKEVFKLPYKHLEPSYLTYVFDMIRYGFMLFFCAGLYPLMIKKLKFLND